MKRFIAILSATMIYMAAYAQSFEGVLKVDYKDESGKINSAEVFIKGDKYYIRRTSGGSEKYGAYLLDVKTHSLTCLNERKPKTALTFDTDKVLAIYEKSKLKPGYKVHESQSYRPISSTKQIGEITATQKKAALDTMAFEIWTTDIKVDFHTLIPVLRISGFWNKTEDGTNAILEGKTTNIRTSKTTTVDIAITKMKVGDKLFELSKDYQVVDLNRFISEQSSSPKIGDLVKGFAGF